MAKKPIFNYRAYLKILGIITIIIGIFGLISAILIPVMKMEVDKLGLSAADIDNLRKTANDDIIRISMGIVAGCVALFTAFEGWLMCRAAKNPEKSTFLLVLLVISVISGVTSVIAVVTGGNIASIITNIVSLILNILALMSVISLRRELNN